MLSQKDYFLLSTQDHPGGKVSLELGDSAGAITAIYSMEEVAKKIISMNHDPHFSVEPNRGNPVLILHGEGSWGERMISFLRLPENGVKILSARYKFHPLVRNLISTCLNENLFGFDESHFPIVTEGSARCYSPEMSNYCNKLNKVISDFKKVISIKGDALSKNFVRGAQQNLKSLKDLFTNLLSIRSTILVVRVDLLYRDAFGVEELGSEETYLYVKMDRERFIAEIQKTYGDGLMGYAWKLEYGVSRGYHYHMVFFFDGARHQQDVKIGKQIGEIWADQTEKHGTYHNCNAYKSQYTVCGVGMFRHSDQDISERFDAMANYLTKADYHGRLILPSRQRSFQTSFCKKKKGNKGRPRRSSNAA